MQEQIVKFLMGLIEKPEDLERVIALIERVLGLIEKYPTAIGIIAELFGLKPPPVAKAIVR